MTWTAPRRRLTAARAPARCRAPNAVTMSRPALRSVLAASMSIALPTRADRIWAGVLVGRAPLIRAATAPACGAAAEVPKNGVRPEPGGSVVDTPSAALTSGLARVLPPPLAHVRPGRSALLGG